MTFADIWSKVRAWLAENGHWLFVVGFAAGYVLGKGWLGKLL